MLTLGSKREFGSVACDTHCASVYTHTHMHISIQLMFVCGQ